MGVKTVGAAIYEPYSLPDQAGHSGAFLTTDGISESWATILSHALAIGQSVGSSIKNAVLYVDGGNNLANDARYLYEQALGMLVVPQAISLGNDTTYMANRPTLVATSGAGSAVAPVNEGTIHYDNGSHHWFNSVNGGNYRQFLSVASGGAVGEVPFYTADNDVISLPNMKWDGFGLKLTNAGSSGGHPMFYTVSSMAENIFQIFDRGRALLDNYSTGGPALTITDHASMPALKIVDGTQGLNKVFTSDAAGNGSWQTLGAATFPGSLAMSQLAYGVGTNTIGGTANMSTDGTTLAFGPINNTQLEYVSGVGFHLNNLGGANSIKFGDNGDVAIKSAAGRGILADSIGNTVVGDAFGVGNGTNLTSNDSSRVINLSANVPHTGPTIPVPTPVLDDVTISGTYTGQPTGSVTYTLTISATGTPDLVDFTDGTTTITAQPINTPLAINGITWAALASTGHGLGDSWTMTATNTATNMLALNGLTNTVKVSTLAGTGSRIVTADSTGVVTATATGACLQPVPPADFDSQTTGLSPTTIFVTPNDGIAHQYRINGYLNINSILVDAIEERISYTDRNANPEDIKMFPVGTTTSILSVSNDYSMQTTIFRALPNSAIDFSAVLTTGGGTIGYDAGYTLEKCN